MVTQAQPALAGKGTGEVITVADAESALASTGHEVRPGDAMFFHTGWGSLWGTDNERYAAGEPGPGRALGHPSSRRVPATSTLTVPVRRMVP